MAAAASSMDVDELFLIAVNQGRNQADADTAAGLLAMPDEEYAAELQLQEVVVASSAMAAAVAQSTLTAPTLIDSDAVGSDDHASSSMDVAAHVDVVLLPVAEAERSSSSSSSAVAPFVPAATFLFCKICMDDVSPSVARRGSHGCEHTFCTACLSLHIAAKIHVGVATAVVRCPEEGCGAAVDPELCQDILPRAVFEAWCVALCWSMVLDASHVYCPFNDCSEIMVDERPAPAAGDVDQSSTECPACRRQFCARCGVAWHAGVSCGEYGELAAGDRGKEDLAVVEMAKGSKWRRCGRCKFFVDKYDGCVHITCRCGFQFCYGCGQEWGSVDHSSCHAT